MRRFCECKAVSISLQERCVKKNSPPTRYIKRAYSAPSFSSRFPQFLLNHRKHNMALADFSYLAEEDPSLRCSLQLAAAADSTFVRVGRRDLATNAVPIDSKLPFDVDDYCNFELNEDFIFSSANFLNDYSSGVTTGSTHGGYDCDNHMDSHHALRMIIEDQSDDNIYHDDSLDWRFDDSFHLPSEPHTPITSKGVHVELLMDDLFHSPTAASQKLIRAVECHPVFPDMLSGKTLMLLTSISRPYLGLILCTNN